MKNIIKRLKAETPAFWKKVRKFAYVAGGISAAVIAANLTQELNLHADLIQALKYVVAVSAAIAASASLTVKDSQS